MNTNISKSLFTKHLQCEKAYYLHSRKIIVPEITLSQQLLFDSGREYEKYVHKMERFKNSIHIQEQCSTVENKMNFTKMLSLTEKMLERSDTVLFEATLSSKFKQNINLFCMIDVLKPNDDGSWNIYEIKSTKSVKPQHIVDLTFQYFTAQQCGLNIRDVHIIHFNGDYVLQDTLDVESLSEVVRKTGEVKKEVQNIDKHIQSIQLTSQLEKIPEKKIGYHCFKPYECLFKTYCWKELPSPNVFDFFGPKTASNFFEKGYVVIEDIPNQKLSSKQIKKVEKYSDGKLLFNKLKIESFLNNLIFPIYYFDFETYAPKVPVFKNSSPHQRIPFQYSIHREDSLSEDCVHLDFLAPANGLDPRLGLLKQLVNQLGKEGSVIVYHKSFEEGVLRELSNLFPEYQSVIDDILSRLVDLELVFLNQYAYHPNMRLSKSSIKIVLEAFTKYSYKNLKGGVTNGSEAMDTFSLMQNGHFNDEEVEKVRNELLAYCELDTLGMYELIKVLRKSIK